MANLMAGEANPHLFPRYTSAIDTCTLDLQAT
jgi:hypothetical protein